MQDILVLGQGHIGSLVSLLLAHTGDYRVHLADLVDKPIETQIQQQCKVPIETVALDINDQEAMLAYIKRFPMKAVISCLPYFCNPAVAAIAKACDLHYFDLTEDVHVAKEIREIAKGQKTAFISHCGLAPGFISIAAQELITHFDSVQSVFMRVGALPVHPNNKLKYALTWSTDGLINQSGNLCYGIVEGTYQALQPLEGLETIEIDGSLYEAFNTSGGLGTLAESYDGQVEHMTYKSLRYPGYADYMQFLMQDLGLNQDRALLKQLLEQSLPKTGEDVVVIYVVVTGQQAGHLREENYVRKIYAQDLASLPWTAIQATTASSVCALLELVLADPKQYQGFIFQEQFSLDAFLSNRFGKIYQ